jgi:hypothetical protein
LIPLNTMFSGLSVIVDRDSGAQRELLAAPVPRPLLVLGNLTVALAVTAFQVVALIAFALARGIDFHPGSTGAAWFVAAAVLFAVGMYGVAETLANRVPKQEEYIARLPAIAIVPWFLAGALFPITALPGFLTWVPQVPAADPRPRPDALRAARRRERPACDLADGRHRRDGRAQPRRGRAFRARPDRDLAPRLRALGGQMMIGTVPPSALQAAPVT